MSIGKSSFSPSSFLGESTSPGWWRRGLFALDALAESFGGVAQSASFSRRTLSVIWWEGDGGGPPARSSDTRRAMGKHEDEIGDG